jgi:hypothetical protein
VNYIISDDHLPIESQQLFCQYASTVMSSHAYAEYRNIHTRLGMNCVHVQHPSTGTVQLCAGNAVMSSDA